MPGDEEVDIEDLGPYTYEDYVDDNYYDEYEDDHYYDDKLPPYIGKQAQVYGEWVEPN